MRHRAPRPSLTGTRIGKISRKASRKMALRQKGHPGSSKQPVLFYGWEPREIRWRRRCPGRCVRCPNSHGGASERGCRGNAGLRRFVPCRAKQKSRHCRRGRDPTSHLETACPPASKSVWLALSGSTWFEISRVRLGHTKSKLLAHNSTTALQMAKHPTSWSMPPSFRICGCSQYLIRCRRRVGDPTHLPKLTLRVPHSRA